LVREGLAALIARESIKLIANGASEKVKKIAKRKKNRDKRASLRPIQVAPAKPAVPLDPARFPTAHAEYSPEQRRLIDSRLKAAEKTPLHGPFRDGKELATYLKSLKSRRLSKPRIGSS
jgi:hypothetical protein